MADLSRLWAIVCDDAGNKLPNIPPLTPKSARLILTAMDTFPASEAVFGADERANLTLIQPLNTLKFYERGVGLVGWYVIEDPSLLIQDTGDEITVTLPNITDQLTRYSVGTGATYEAAIGDIVADIGAKGESVAWKTFYDTTGTITGFSAAYPDLIRFYDTKGNLTGTIPGTGKFSGWSAVARDDSANVLSAAAVVWSAIGTVQPLANNLAKLTSGAPVYDSVARSVNLIAAATDANGNPAASDGSFQWQARDVTTQVLAGLGADNATLTTDVMYGFELLPSAAPAVLNATGTWNYWEGGVRVPVGAVYSAGDTFAVAVDYTTGTPRIVYTHNGFPVRQGVGAPVLPYRPLAFIFTPGGGIQNAMLMSTVKPSRQTYSIAFAQQTPLEALIQLANATGIHVRQQADGTGAPIRALELGTLGMQTNVRLTGGVGGDLARMQTNPQVRIVTALTWKQESAQVINTVTPLGASNGDAQVDLAPCSSIVNDPGYRNYFQKWGGLANIFPEYVTYGTTYPIARTLNRDGTWEYWVRDVAAYNRIGFEIRGKYTDPQFRDVDTVIANQELTARALYIAAVAKLKWESQINDTLDVETVATFRPPQAGSRVKMDFTRIGGDVRGNFAVMSTAARANLQQPYVTQVERTYNNGGSAFDKWALSFLSRNVIDPAAGGAASLRDLEAIKIVTANQTTYFAVGGESDVDASQNAEHALIVQIRIPQEVFRITAAPLDVQFSPLRQQVTTAANQAAGFTITVPIQEIDVSLPHGTHDLSGTFDTNNVDLYVHIYQTSGAGGGAVSAGFLPGPQAYVLNVPGASGDVKVSKSTGTTDAQHGHTTQFTKATVASQFDHLTGTIPGYTINATLPPHTHPIATNLNDTFAPTLVGLWVDPGTGVWKEISALVADQLSGLVGPWGASFFLPDLSQFVNYPGQLVRLKLDSRGTANLGVGHLKATGLWRAVIGGGVGQTVFPATAA